MELSPQDRRAVAAGCRYDREAARHAVAFFTQFLRHSKGKWAGEPFTLLRWQDRVIRQLFGWKRKDGTRRYRRAGIWVPKKNGKSTLAAGVILYLLVADDENGAEVYSAANDRGQASIIYHEAANMVRQSPHLARRVQAIDSRKTLAYPARYARYEALSADVPTKEGLNASGVVVDELHAQKSRAMWDTLIYAGAAREQPLHLSISTAGVRDTTSIGWEQYEYARKVATDQIDDWAFLSIIYEAGPHDEWTDPAIWKKANPSFGTTIQPHIFAEECREAEASPAKQNTFRRYRLNQWTAQAERALDLKLWDANNIHPIVLEVLAGRRCWGGLDLAAVSDLTAWVLLFPCDADPDALDVLARFWVPEAQLRTGRLRDLYQSWVDAGYLTVTPGEAVDYGQVRVDVLADAEGFDLKDLNVDRLFQGQQLAQELTEEGLTVLAIGQGFLSFAAPMVEFFRRLTARQLHHGGNPILRWMADNLVVKLDPAGNMKPDKQRSTEKIDGIVALVMALDRVTRQGGEKPPGYQMFVFGGPPP
jgi:phage terminase large subunit-like protein